MNTLTATRTVLRRDTVASGRFTHKSGREQQRFVSHEDTERKHMLFLDAAYDDELGNPDQITVTVEPGDMLNLEPCADVGSHPIGKHHDAVRAAEADA